MKKLEKGFVIPLIIAVVAILAIGGTVYFADHGKAEAPIVEILKTYTIDDAVSFDYPSLLSLKKVGEVVNLSHLVPYKHPNPCDFKGDSPPLDSISDFGVSFRISNDNVDITKKNTFVWNYEKFSVGSLDGFVGESGIEGCGQYTYLFPISENKTLIVNRGYVPEFNPINIDYKTYLSVPGIIMPNQADEIFYNILSSIKFTDTLSGQDNSVLKITSISPSSGPVGSIVTLKGGGFTLGQQTFVSISESDQKAWDIISVSTTTLVFAIPSNLSVGTHDVSVMVSAKHTPISNVVKFTVTNSNPVSSNPIACTMDAMMCPDGSYVGRSGPNCEFVCPVAVKCVPEGGKNYENVFSSIPMDQRLKCCPGLVSREDPRLADAPAVCVKP